MKSHMYKLFFVDFIYILKVHNFENLKDNIYIRVFTYTR